MKSIMTGAVCFGAGIVAGIIITRNLHETGPAPAPVVVSTAVPANDEKQTERTVTPKPEPTPAVPVKTNDATPTPVVAAPASAPESPKAAALRRAVETLVSPQASFQEKQAVLKQLREGGQLDDALAALRQGAAENPNSPAYPIAIGEVDLQKAYLLSRSGGSVNQMGMVGMDADQNFDDALKLDPANWEAQFFKAAAMSHWPAEMNKGPEVIQRFSTLIDQQDTMPAQPQFAQSYVLLGDQYQKAGQPDYALQTWQLGAQKFPTDTALQGKIAGARNQ